MKSINDDPFNSTSGVQTSELKLPAGPHEDSHCAAKIILCIKDSNCKRDQINFPNHFKVILDISGST